MAETEIKKSSQRWQSDVIVDLIKQYEFPYIALNPGASYRGLHDSLVNYGENQPPMLLCNHEKIAVQIAHGYAKASGKPMMAIVHNVVGLLHAPMGIYYAYIDRSPVFIVGATGPMDENSAGRSSIGSIPPSPKATWCAALPSGTINPAAFTVCRIRSRAPTRS